jgi:2-deoxy-scyllo-inosamine dehydrogenase (SAM-dependent)
MLMKRFLATIKKLRRNPSRDIPPMGRTEIGGSDIFRFTTRISIELSNLCSYAGIHKKCPLSLVEEPVILPSSIVYNVISTLDRFNFRGIIAFHTYNEPLMDPRLVKFIEVARKACPENEIFICTNGYYLDQGMANDLVHSGVSRIRVSAYSEKEYDRLSKIRLRIPYSVEISTLDNRLDLYNSPENDTQTPCFAPLNEIIITREGCISLCCLDWKREHSFGDLKKQSFEEMIRSGELQSVYERLRAGDRFLPICKRCGWSR